MPDDTAVETAVVDALIHGSLTIGTLPDAELLVVVDELAARRRRIDAALAAAVGELGIRSEGLPAEESLVRRAGHATTAQLLQHRIGIRLREARVLCAVATATRATVSMSGSDVPAPFPRVAAALASGWIAIPQAHAIIDVLSSAGGRVAVGDLDIAERDLVERAVGEPSEGAASTPGAVDEAPVIPEHLAMLAKRWLAHLDPDGEEPRYDRQLAERYFTLTRRGDGMVAGRFLCTAEQGEILQTALDAHVKPRRVQFREVCEPPPHDPGGEQRTAEQHLDDENRGEHHRVDQHVADEGTDDEPSIDDRTRTQRRVDALVAIVGRHAELYAPRVAGEAPVLTITVSEQALRGRADSPATMPRLERSGDPVPVSVAARILCDGFVQPIVLGHGSEPLRQGRRRRLFTRSQRRAIIARDERCQAPGCTAPPGWCETHHVTRWADGGATDVDNGILLCQHHHTEVHRGALEIVADGTRRWRIVATHRRRSRVRPPLPTRPPIAA